MKFMSYALKGAFPGIAVLSKPQPLKAECLDAIYGSLKKAGYSVRTTFDESGPEPILFVWSWGRAVIARKKNPGAIICCLDHGYTKDRAQYINTGWSTPDIPTGLNGFAEHLWIDDGGQRAREQNLLDEIKAPRATKLKRALLFGQVYGDAMIRGQVSDYKSWLRETVDKLVEAGYDVTFRPHPVMVRRGLSAEYGNLGRISPYGDLWASLKEADLGVALNSNALVAALLDGIPVDWYNEGTMLSPLKGMTDPDRFAAREEWLGRIAWTQWTLEELASGKWLEYHKSIMHRLAGGDPALPWCRRKL